MVERPQRPESEKAVRYLAQLDTARCEGRWTDIPELCRKVEKHAPHRKCLTLTARVESRIAARSTQTSTTAVSTTSSSLSEAIPSLLTAIEEESDHVQDAFQATVCLGWLHCILEEPALAIGRLPKDFAAVATKLLDTHLSGWSKVCIVKGVFLKGTSQEKTGVTQDAVASYQTILPWLSTQVKSTDSLQFRTWTEHLLVRLCHLSDQSTEIAQYTDLTEALQTYRFWAKYCELTSNFKGNEAKNSPQYRRLAWKAYYDTLSVVLCKDYPYQPDQTTISTGSAPEKAPPSSLRLQQRAELKKVEVAYEGLLLRDTHFPEASESNEEIEKWVETAMENWRHLCGPRWSDADLGEGGKEAVGRGVLDILYRAATKTYHSTQILRHVFTVHAALAEFDLAFKAYDSYIEIVTRGRDRAEQSGEQDVSIDDDSIVLRTSAQAIRLLCRFGSSKEAEKAFAMGQSIQKRLTHKEHLAESTSEAGSALSTSINIEPRALAVGYYAIGLSQAQWACYTTEAEARAGIQADAVQSLRKSLSPRLEDPNNLESLFALALLLAQMRDLTGALKIVKRALSPATKHKSETSIDGVISAGVSTEYGRERKSIALWHLLSLLLTSRDDYGAAEKACEAAFEQFGDPAVLFGSENASAYRSELLNDTNGERGALCGLVDEMELTEKFGVIQIKMTQLALVEVTDGASVAVDGCDELLALYARLIGGPSIAHKPRTDMPDSKFSPPKSSAGTIRSSIFRAKNSIRGTQRQSKVRPASVLSSPASTIATRNSVTPAIQVTDEHVTNNPQEHHHHHHHLFHQHQHAVRPSPQRTPSKLQKRMSKGEAPVPEVRELPDAPTNGSPTKSNNNRSASLRRQSLTDTARQPADGPDSPLRPVVHNMSPAAEPLPQKHRETPKQDTRLPAPFPNSSYVPSDPYFSKLQDRRQKVTLLVSIWLFIAGLYSRADVSEDAKDAVAEAFKLVATLESEVAQDSSSARAFADRGFGVGKSVDELWADAYAARGQLLTAQSLPHDARVDFERALLHFPNHAGAIIGLSNILLDMYREIIPLEPGPPSSSSTSSHHIVTPTAANPTPLHQISTSPKAPITTTVAVLRPQTSASTSSTTRPAPASTSTKTKTLLTPHTPSLVNSLPPQTLTRLAARDRATSLLSTLTKLASGWHNAEAWFALARALECCDDDTGGSVENGMEKVPSAIASAPTNAALRKRVEEVLWWCVELGEGKGVRGWGVVGGGAVGGDVGGYVL